MLPTLPSPQPFELPSIPPVYGGGGGSGGGATDTVVDGAPTVLITFPKNGDVLPVGTTKITPEGTAADDKTVTLVQGSVNGSPFADAKGNNPWSIDILGLQNGQTYTLIMKAIDDASNTAQATVTFSIAAIVPDPDPDPDPDPTDTTPPTVAIMFPINNGVVTGTVVAIGTASDNVGVAKLVWYIDGAELKTDNQAPYEFTIASTNYANGNHLLKVIAHDTSGNIAETTITININNLIPPQPNGRLENVALFRPGDAAVRERTSDIYSDTLTGTDFIGTYEPGNNWNEVKELGQSSGADIYIGIANLQGVIDGKYPGAEWIMFDLELPVPQGEESNRQLIEGEKMVHDAGLKYIPNLGSDANDNIDNVKTAAELGDMLIIQVMGHQNNPTTFKNFVEKTVGWAREANPNIPVCIGPSVSIRGENDQFREPTYVKTLIDSVKDKVDCVHMFYGTHDSGTPLNTLDRLEQVMALLYGSSGGITDVDIFGVTMIYPTKS